MAAVTIATGYPIHSAADDKDGFITSIYKITNGSLDDNSTLDTGLANVIPVGWVSTVDNSDFAIDDISSVGVLTFGSSANNGGYLTLKHTGVLA